MYNDTYTDENGDQRWGPAYVTKTNTPLVGLYYHKKDKQNVMRDRSVSNLTTEPTGGRTYHRQRLPSSNDESVVFDVTHELGTVDAVFVVHEGEIVCGFYLHSDQSEVDLSNETEVVATDIGWEAAEQFIDDN